MKSIIIMAIAITKSLPATCFSSTIPDIEFSVSGTSASVDITVDGERIYLETLFPIGGKIRLRDLPNLLTPYARQSLAVDVSIKITEMTGSTSGSTSTVSTRVVYCKADICQGADAATVASFCDNHFLSILLGKKLTAERRLEYLHYLGSEAASVEARYSDGSSASFTAQKVAGNGKYTTIDVSPRFFMANGKTLMSYTVKAGNRTQEFLVDPSNPDCAPILLFVNSFGCDELVYCIGKHDVSPTYNRSSAFIDGLMRNYDIKETRLFKADTGVLNTPMANWLDDLFRSESVRVMNYMGGQMTPGKEVTITDSKSDNSNEDSFMPRFTFSYRYSQKNQNVLELGRAGRIFDNTFDNTFN